MKFKDQLRSGTKFPSPAFVKKIAGLAMLGAALVYLLSSFSKSVHQKAKHEKEKDAPKIVNIINFVRLLEPRDSTITEEVLYATVVSQIELMRKYKLGGTFLLQYDALLDPRYQNILKSLPRDSFEVGAWWEIPQPMVENAGLKWRGRYPWDWRADVGFSTGYTPAEREKLADVYMRDFKKIFGYYPKSVGCWFIDAYTLDYLYKKYKIVASCNCKDQVGTDGYTLWGGYWNQGYYPSRTNSYMPAQTEQNQIPVPIFRMLGSDPIRQYDNGLGAERQGVVTLEPVYKFGGGDANWVNWYFNQFVEGACMQYAYVQAGQENSFTWEGMKKGFEIQLPLIARLRNEKKVTVETLEETGEWFRKNYKTTPATSVTITKDLQGSNEKTVWFDSRFYRINLLWENGTLRFRDIHLFDENFPSICTNQQATSNDCSFFTLPLVDGYMWSSPGKYAGLRFKNMQDGKVILMQGKDPIVTDAMPGILHICWPLSLCNDTLVMNIYERKVNMTLQGKDKLNWFLDLTASSTAALPFKKISGTNIQCRFHAMDYNVSATQGSFSKPDDSTIFRITPRNNTIEFDLSRDGHPK
jgi:hypothetical protein